MAEHLTSDSGPVTTADDEPPEERPGARDGTEEAEQYAEEDPAVADHIRGLRRRGLQGIRVAGGAVGFGAGDAAGTINKHYYASAPHADPVDGRIREEDLDRLRERYVEPDSHRALTALLLKEGVAVLRGAPGSGRYTTALLAAQEVMDAEVVLLDPEMDLKRLLSRGGDLQAGRGHVVEGDGRPWASQLRPQLLSRLKEVTYRRSPLVVVVDDQVPVDGLDAHVVEHRVPEGLRFEALARHLAVRLTDRPGACEKLLRHDSVRAGLNGRTTLTEIHAVARRLERCERDGDDVDTIAQGFQAQLRAKAKELLRAPVRGAGPQGGKQEVSLWARAFLLACVVLDGGRLSRVSRESHQLAALLHGVRSPSVEPEMRLFEEGLSDWLDTSVVERIDGSGGPAEEGHPDCRVRIARPGLGEALLETLCLEHGGARAPLLAWLDSLVVRGEEDIRVSAAQAAGLLAGFDWDYVLEELLVPWATAKGDHADRRRHAAAWALERAAADPVLAPRVQRLLRDWSRRRDRQACAQVAYGTAIGARYPLEALGSLERIAGTSLRGVRSAVREIYAAGAREQTIERLAAWAESPHSGLRGEAAACLQQLSRFRGDLAVTGFLADPVQHGHLLRLMRGTLSSPRPGVPQRGWDSLRSWIERSGDEPGLDTTLVAFVTELFLDDGSAAGLRERFLFFLRLWSHQGVGFDAAAQFNSLVTERWST
ncbi:hypothetical protein [Streptomyces sp. NPDC008121]|uniref:hypothetical protein n=1 Tax=Streptomyces sp. NPDC008121 TaxID=3364809 RepID=UPI0036EEDF4C